MHDSCPKAESGISVQGMGSTWWQRDPIKCWHTLHSPCIHLAFLTVVEPKLAVSLYDVIFPAMCPGLVYTGLLAAKLGVSLGNQAGSVWRDLGISILPAPLLHQS